MQIQEVVENIEWYLFLFSGSFDIFLLNYKNVMNIALFPVCSEEFAKEIMKNSKQQNLLFSIPSTTCWKHETMIKQSSIFCN